MKRVQATLEELETMLHEPVEEGYDPPVPLYGPPKYERGQYAVVNLRGDVQTVIIASIPQGADPFYTGANSKKGLFAFFESDIVKIVTHIEYQQANFGA